MMIEAQTPHMIFITLAEADVARIEMLWVFCAWKLMQVERDWLLLCSDKRVQIRGFVVMVAMAVVMTVVDLVVVVVTVVVVSGGAG